MAKTNYKWSGWFGVLSGLARGICFKNRYEGVPFMNMETIWNNIKQHEGEAFYTITGIEYEYVVYTDYLLVNDLKSRRITKDMIEKAIAIDNPTPKKIELEGCRGPSYIWGIITDKRIKNLVG